MYAYKYMNRIKIRVIAICYAINPPFSYNKFLLFLVFFSFFKFNC